MVQTSVHIPTRNRYFGIEDGGKARKLSQGIFVEGLWGIIFEEVSKGAVGGKDAIGRGHGWV